MTERSRALAIEVARRAIEAAERRERAEANPDEVAERLRQAAGEDGQISIDDAVAAVSGDEDTVSFNDLLRRAPAATGRRRALDERLFGKRDEPEPESDPAPEPAQPSGDADGGKGEGEDYPIEYVETADGLVPMRVLDINNPTDHDNTEEKKP